MVNKILLGICSMMFMLLLSCNEEHVQEVEIVIGTGAFSETINNEVSIAVSPTYLQVGDYITISVTHKDDKKVPVILSSESLDIEETITTPSVVKKQINVAGKHDLTLKYETEGGAIAASSTITITTVE